MTARAYKEYMDYCMLKQECFDSGKQEGYEQGIEQGKLEDARNMIARKQLSLEDISEYTGLSMEKVRELAGESNQIRRTI